jgi:phage gp36-like protein
VLFRSDACNLIDGYLASRYTLPLSSVPDIVKAWACDIARFKLWDERAPAEVRTRFEDAVGQLKDVAKGHLSLPPGSNGETPTASGAANMTGFSNTRLFTEETLAGF